MTLGGGVSGFVGGTGYTGEDGVELFVPVEAAADVWRALVEAGVTPAGLGARDTLRLEMGYPLHGHELGPGITPLQAGLGWVIGWDKPAFVGRDALVAEKERGPARQLAGILLADRQVPRAQCPVRIGGEAVGEVTSGNVSPIAGAGNRPGFPAPGDVTGNRSGDRHPGPGRGRGGRQAAVREDRFLSPTGVPQFHALEPRNAGSEPAAHTGREARPRSAHDVRPRQEPGLWSGAWVPSSPTRRRRSRPCLGSWASTASTNSSPTSPTPSAWRAGWRWNRAGPRPTSSTGWGRWPAATGPPARPRERGSWCASPAAAPTTTTFRPRCGRWPAAASSSPPTRRTNRSWPRACSRPSSSTRRCCAASPGWTSPTLPSTTPPRPPSRG